jgi:hypothetical protein
MAKSIHISRTDMANFLSRQGFMEVKIPGTREMVMGRIVAPGMCLRVYTSVEGEQTRDNGEDAIRCVLVTKVADNTRIVGSDRRVHRVEGWKANLQNRLDNWRDQLGPTCPKCGAPTTRRRSRRGFFWGCSNYPNCRGLVPIEQPSRQLVAAAKPKYEDEFDQHMANITDSD